MQIWPSLLGLEDGKAVNFTNHISLIKEILNTKNGNNWLFSLQEEVKNAILLTDDGRRPMPISHLNNSRDLKSFTLLQF